MLKKKKGG
jgi:hypothetical protein